MTALEKFLFCENLYKTNTEFKEFVDKTCNAGVYKDERKVPDIFSHQTIYDVAVYFSKKNEDVVNDPIKPIKIEEEDKSC